MHFKFFGNRNTGNEWTYFIQVLTFSPFWLFVWLDTLLDSDFPVLLKERALYWNVFFYFLQVEKESESEESDEDEGPAPVIVENESYVNLKKKISKRYDWQAKSVHAENGKICKQFRMKQVGYAREWVALPP